MKVRKNHTRFLCGSLAAAAAISPILSITAWADNISTANFNLRQQVVKLTGIMEISSFRESVTRADFAKMLVKASSYRENLPTSNVSVYADVPATDPNAVYIRIAAREGWMSGYLGGKFKPEDPVLYKNAVKAILTMLGYTDDDFTGDLVSSRISKFNYLELNEDVSRQAADEVNQTDCMNIFYNLLKTKKKDSNEIYGTILDCELNSDGEIYEDKYGLTTSQRLYGTVTENKEGRGPCYLKTDEISDEQQSDLYKAYLNMAPSQTLKWIESGRGPKNENVEIEGTEPYIVGGHTASGYWIDNDRKTTITGLYAAGDVAGGCPQKYVTGALVEGEIAAQSAVEYIRVIKNSENKKADYDNVSKNSDNAVNGLSSADKKAEYESYFSNQKGFIDTEQLEETMQKIMDQYAGGISTNYEYNESRLEIAKRKIDDIEKLSENLHADDMDDLLRIYELKERLVVCKVLIEHLKARKETRWHSFAENLDYPNKSDDYLKYVNSRYEDGKIKIIYRDLVTGGKVYEHSDK